MKLDTRTLKIGDRVRIVIETQVSDLNPCGWISTGYNEFRHDQSDIVSIELIPPDPPEGEA